MNNTVPGAVANHHYFDREVGQAAVKLLPAEYYVTSSDMVLSTVLGSCVAACLQDAEAGIAGMNHFMLPDDGDATQRTPGESMRYGAYSMNVLISEMVRAGARRERIRAKVFGGGAVLTNMTTLKIGERNADFVLRYLTGEHIAIAAQDLRGPHARRVSFVPSTGKAAVLKLRTQTDLQLVQNEESELFKKFADTRSASVFDKVNPIHTAAAAMKRDRW